MGIKEFFVSTIMVVLVFVFISSYVGICDLGDIYGTEISRNDFLPTQIVFGVERIVSSMTLLVVE